MDRKYICPLAQLVEQRLLIAGPRFESARGSHLNKRRKHVCCKKLQSLKLADDTMITLTREEGTDVFVHNETEVEDAMNERALFTILLLLLLTPVDARNRWSGNIIQHLRDNDYLEDYERGSFAFEDFLVETLYFYDTDLIELD